MTEKPKAQAASSASPFDVSKLMGQFDPSKMMDEFTKVVGDYNLPGIDVKAIMDSSRKNVEALASANKEALEGMQAVLTRQGEILRETMDDASAAMKELAGSGSPTEAVSKQGELLKNALEKALANMRELAEMSAKSNTGAFDTIKTRVNESLTEIKGLVASMKK